MRTSAALVLIVSLASPMASGAGPRDCSRIDDPLQVLDLFLEMEPADWELVLRDDTFSVERPALFHACGEEPLEVRVRRKKGRPLPRTGEGDPVKVGLKVDFDDLVPGQEWNGHRKLSLENGAPNFDGSTVFREGLSWQLMARSGLIGGTGVWVRLHVNGVLIGVFTRVEEVDRSFLRRHLGEDDWFLYKYDPELADQGYRRRLTREGEPDPFEEGLCYPPIGYTCAMPAETPADLAERLDVHQLLTLAAVNALIGNTDGPFRMQSNAFWYSSPRPRIYFPWDLDLAFRDDPAADPHGGLSSPLEAFFFRDPALRAQFDTILRRLVDDAFHPEALEELFAELSVAVGPALEADPLAHLEAGFPGEVEALLAYLRARREAILRAIPSRRPAARRDQRAPRRERRRAARRGRPRGGLGGALQPERRAGLPGRALPLGRPRPAGAVGTPRHRPPAGRAPPRLVRRTAGGGSPPRRLQARRRWPRRWGSTASGTGPRRRSTSCASGRRRPASPWDGSPTAPPASARSPASLPAPGTSSTAGRAPGSSAATRTSTARSTSPTPSSSWRASSEESRSPAPGWPTADYGGEIDITDAIALLGHLFQGGAAPPPPFPACGLDPTEDGLPCPSPPACR